MISYRLAYTAIVALLLSSSLLHAQEDAGLQIEAQPLDSALREFAEQTGLQLMYSAEIGEGVQSQGAGEAETSAQALDHLLADTGLQYWFINDRTIAIQAVATNVAEERGGSDSKNSSPRAVMTTQAMGSQSQSNQSTDQSNDDTGSVSGSVKAEDSEANLKGALITIVESGQTTSTDALGQFRFPTVRVGEYTLRVSFLGYAETETTVTVSAEATAVRNFALRGGTEIEEIMVYGQRSARALALNQERTAENFVSVLSSDVLGQFNSTTISEALRRAPGIAFVPNPDTGDGTNVIIRGLQPDFNQVTLNGLRIPEGSGIGRSADLSGLLTESVESVTISKTLLANQDSSGTGGLVEIETKSPLDRDRRFASFGFEYGERGNDQGDDALLSGTLSGRFGADESFGASISAQYREREVTNINYSLGVALSRLGPYLPLDGDGNPISSGFQFLPTDLIPFEPGVEPKLYPESSLSNLSTVNDENTTITGSLQKLVGDHTDLRLDLSLSRTEATSISTGTRSHVFTRMQLVPIDELGGELRYAPISEDLFAPFAPGIVGGVTRQASYVESESETTTLSFRGTTNHNEWQVDYSLGYADGSTKRPLWGEAGTGEISPAFDSFFIRPEDLTDEILANTNGGLLTSVFLPLVQGQSGVFILPGFSQAGLDRYNSTDLQLIGNAQDGLFTRYGGGGENNRLTSTFTIRKDVDGRHLKYLEAGLFFEEADFERSPSVESASISRPAVPLADLGLEFGPGILTSVGAPLDLDRLTQSSIANYFANFRALDASGIFGSTGNIGPTDPLQNYARSTEEDFAAYVQGRVDFGKLEIIGGVRFTRVNIHSSYTAGPFFTDEFGVSDPTYHDRFGGIIDDSGSQSDVLPRFLANYRWSDNAIVRAAYFTSVARPQIQNLTRSSSFSLDLRERYGPDANQPRMSIRQGNDELRPAFTHNFDLSWERYTESLGVTKVSVFYKRTVDGLQNTRDSGDLSIVDADVRIPDTPEYNAALARDDLFFEINQPVNDDGTEDIWGLELAYEQQFSSLPGVWGGLGVYANYTYTDSARDFIFFDTSSRNMDIVIPDVPYDGSPKHSGTAAITYNQYGFDGSLQFTHQDRRLSSYRRFGLHRYDEQLNTLDFRLEYLTGIGDADLRVFLRATDLLRSSDDPYIENTLGGENGVPKYYVGGRFFGGPSVFIGTSAVF